MLTAHVAELLVFKVLTCVTAHHDLRLVLLAAVVCAITPLGTFRFYGTASGLSRRARVIWLSVTGLIAGFGIWATPFVAMLAFEPSVPTGYSPSLTMLSLALAVGFSIAGFTLAAKNPAGVA